VRAHFLLRKKPGFPLQSFLPLCGKKGFPLQSLAHLRASSDFAKQNRDQPLAHPGAIRSNSPELQAVQADPRNCTGNFASIFQQVAARPYRGEDFSLL
jgi:hypothetical protein